MTPKICPHCQRVHPPHLLRCPETRALLDFEGRELQARYRFVCSIGQSAHARVWEAKHIGTGRTVVIKMLRPEYLDDLALLSRFEQEASLGGRVHSDYVVPIFDQGHSEAGPFLVMDWAPGESLQERLAQDHAQVGPWPLAMVLRWAKCVASGLMAIHHAGVVHRDLKPSNMIVHGHGEEFGVKLLDFGVAKSLCHEGHTAAGALLGTQAYMPPEQRQDAANVDERADLYAFGVILDQLLRGVDEPNSDRGPLRDVDALPQAWRSLHASLLAADPQDRPPSARALYQELCRLDPMPVNEAPVGDMRGSRPRAPVWGGLAAGLALGGGIVWMAAAPAEVPLRSQEGRAVAHASVVSPFAGGSIDSARPLLASRESSPQCLALEPSSAPDASARRARPFRVQKERPSRVGRTPRSSPLPDREPMRLKSRVFPEPSAPSVAQRPDRSSDSGEPKSVTKVRPASSVGARRVSGTQLVMGGLRALGERSSPMGFFDARQYCKSLGRTRHQGLSSWRLAFPDEVARWAQVKGIRTGWYWTDALEAGRAQVVGLPSKRRFMARVRRRFIRPFCVAPLEGGQADAKVVER